MKPSILFIHGLLNTLAAPHVTAAFGTANVLIPDLLGYGCYRNIDTSGMTLEGQADHLARLLAESRFPQAHLIGHSIGGSIALMLAERHPNLVRSLTNVEGNFTLGDAFWTNRLANMPAHEVEAEFDGYRSAPAAWMQAMGMDATERNMLALRHALDNQPATTIKAQSQAVVKATAQPAFLETARRVLASGLPCHLVAGERSRPDWHVPDWVRQVADESLIPATGHLMMLEEPGLFAKATLGWLARLES